MTYRSHTTAPARNFDHLYDPLYITSSYKDVWKKNLESLHKTAPIQVFPIYQNMFSELILDTRNQFTLLQNPLPVTVDPGAFRTDVRCQTNYGPIDINGCDRAKYFSYPISNIQTINVQLDEAPMKELECNLPRQRTQASQTLFRESSAQTLPWMPEAYIRNDICETPEIFEFATILEGFGFPGLKEVEIIERVRSKRDWENQLPLARSPEEFKQRQTVLQAFEWDQWTQRETEIDMCQKMRYRMVLQMMQDRDENNKYSSDVKLENTLRRLEKEKEAQLEKIRLTRQRNIRKLDKKHKTSMKCSKKETDFKDLIETITVPLPSRRRTSSIFAKQFETSYLETTGLEIKSPNIQKYIKAQKPLWKPKEEIKEVQKGLWTDKFLGDLYDSLKHFRQKTETKRELPKCLVYVPSPVDSDEFQSPSTGTVIEPDHEAEADYQNAIMVQKYVKGRALQNVILKGKDQCKELIRELQGTNCIESVRTLFPENFVSKIESKENVEEQQEHVEEAVKTEEGKPKAHIEFLLEFLSGEIDRLEEERKAHALFLLAEQQREQREVEEKKRCEEIYRNVLKAEHDIVSTYLENVLLEGITNVSEKEARKYIKDVAQKIDIEANKNTEEPEQCITTLLKEHVFPQILEKLPESNIYMIGEILENCLKTDMVQRISESQESFTDLESMTTFMNDHVVPNLLKKISEQNMWDEKTCGEMQITSELIQEFVAPEIFKILARERQKKERQVHLLAAHDAIWNTVEELPFVTCDDNSKDQSETTPNEENKSVSTIRQEAEHESMQAIDKSINKTVTHVLKLQHSEGSKDLSDASSAQLSFQKELLNRIVNNLNEKLKKQVESEFEYGRRQSSSRTSIDIYLQGTDGNERTEVDDE